MSVSAPVKGPLVTKTTLILGILVLIALYFIAERMIFGLGSVTNLNDGYPWGIWIAYDVVIGTAFACGGYAMALLVYIFNKGKYHPLVRPALLASMFGYTLGGLSIILDLGRWWNAWHIFVPGLGQVNSVMFEVALCVSAYIIVLWIEFAPTLLQKFGFVDLRAKLDKVLFVFIAIGVLLPTMHQSSLGSLLVVMGYQIHPLWQTPILPILFLISAICMGYAITVWEVCVSGAGFKRPIRDEIPLMAGLAKIICALAAVYLVVRWGDLAIQGKLGLVLTSGKYTAWFVLENTLFVYAIVVLSNKNLRNKAKPLFIGATSLLLAGALYRLNGYLIAYQTGAGWNYFPSVAEMMVTIGIIAGEILAYIIFVKTLPVLPAHDFGGEPAEDFHPAPRPAE